MPWAACSCFAALQMRVHVLRRSIIVPHDTHAQASGPGFQGPGHCQWRGSGDALCNPCLVPPCCATCCTLPMMRRMCLQVRISGWFGDLESTFYKHPHSPHPDVFRVSNDRQHGCTGALSRTAAGFSHAPVLCPHPAAGCADDSNLATISK